MKKIIILIIAFCSIALSQNTEFSRFSLSSKGFVNAWLLRGSYPINETNSREEDFMKSEGGETKKISLETIKNNIGFDHHFKETNKWYPVYSESYLIDLLPEYKLNKRAVSYALCYMESDKNQTIKLKFGSDDGIKLFFNGELVYDNPAQRGVVIDNDEIEIEVIKGINTLLLKIDQGGGDWGFCLRILGENGEPPDNIKIILPYEFSSDTLVKTVVSSFNLATLLSKRAENLENASAFMQSVFISLISLEAGIPQNLDLSIKIKLVFMNSSNQILDEYYKKELPNLARYREEKIIYAPKNSEPGQYIIRMIISDKDNNELISKDNIVFWN